MNGFSCDEARRLLDEQTLGALGEEEQAALEVHLAVCDDCRERQRLWDGLQHAVRTAPLPELDPLVERRMLSGVEPASREAQRRRTPAWAWGAGLALAAGIAGLALLLGPKLLLLQDDGDGAPVAPLAEATDETPVPEVAPPPADWTPAEAQVVDGRRVLPGAAEGTALWLDRDALVRVDRNDEQVAHFDLRDGLVVAEVGDNREGFRFVVETPQVQVVAHGTVFSVEVTEQGDEIYRVTEGVVEVIPLAQDHTASLALDEGMELHSGADAAVLADAIGLARDRALMPQDEVADAAAAAPDELEGELLARVDPTAPAAPPSIEALTRQAQQHQVARQYDEACAAYQQLIEQHPGSAAALNGHVAMGQMQLDAMGQPADSLGHFEAYLSEAPAGTLAAEARVGRVRALSSLGRHDELIRAADEFLAAHPDGSASPEVVRLRADARRARGDCGRARGDYEELIERWPDSPQADHAKAGIAACDGPDPS